MTDKQTDKRTDKQTDKRTDKQTDGQSDFQLVDLIPFSRRGPSENLDHLKGSTSWSDLDHSFVWSGSEARLENQDWTDWKCFWWQQSLQKTVLVCFSKVVCNIKRQRSSFMHVKYQISIFSDYHSVLEPMLNIHCTCIAKKTL